MAETTPTQEESRLRRRARRRLVGAVALALAAVVVLPMVFDSEPRPLGDKVDIRIPDQKTPFEPATPPMPAVTAPAEPMPLPAEPPSAPEADQAIGKPQPGAKPVAKPVLKAQPAIKPEAKPDPQPAEVKPAETGGYYLQLGVFSSKANATQMIAKAKAAGFKSSSIQVGKQFKVWVGLVAERDKALDYQAKLKAKGLDNVLVEP